MRFMTVAFALGTALVLFGAGTSDVTARARHPRVIEPRERLIVTVPVVRPPPYYWDSNIVPRYRYRPEDDRVDPNGPPVVPVIRLGDGGEIYLPRWWW
jgi:hypothetical protein